MIIFADNPQNGDSNFMRDFRELLNGDGIHIFDGAIGTRFYDKGIYINRSYDELNLINKDLVREVH